MQKAYHVYDQLAGDAAQLLHQVCLPKPALSLLISTADTSSAPDGKSMLYRAMLVVLAVNAPLRAALGHPDSVQGWAGQSCLQKKSSFPLLSRLFMKARKLCDGKGSLHLLPSVTPASSRCVSA